MQQRTFRISGNNKGLVCPFKPTGCIVCEEGYCQECQVYVDWQKQGEIVVVCAWCGKEIERKPGLGQSGVSHGICAECKQKHFPTLVGTNREELDES